MAWREPHPIFLLLLLAACLAPARGETRFEKFQRQHVAPPRPDHRDNRLYCNRLMPNRNLTQPLCKPTNTFVHVADVGSVAAVCGPGGTPAGENLRDSVAPFDLTTCRLKGRPRRLPCDYSGYTSYRRVRIACDKQGDPVHYYGAIQPLLGP